MLAAGVADAMIKAWDLYRANGAQEGSENVCKEGLPPHVAPYDSFSILGLVARSWRAVIPGQREAPTPTTSPGHARQPRALGRDRARSVQARFTHPAG